MSFQDILNTFVAAVTGRQLWVSSAVAIVGLVGLLGVVWLLGRAWRGRFTALGGAALLLCLAVSLQVVMLFEPAAEGPLPFLADLMRLMAPWIERVLDVPLGFADPGQPLGSVLLNLGLGFLLLSVTVAAAPIVRKLVSLVGHARERTGNQLAEEENAAASIAGWFLHRPPLARVYLILVGTSAAAGLVLVGWLCADVEDSFARDAIPASKRALWTAPCLIFGLLWAATRRAENPRPLQKSTAGATAKADEPDLLALYESYASDFKAHLLLAKASPAESLQAGRADVDETAERIARVAKRENLAGGAALGAALGRKLSGIWGGGHRAASGKPERLALLIGEEANFLHFLVLAELILSAQDRGTTTLVIAPESSFDRVGSAIGRALQAFEGGPTQRLFLGNEQPSGRYDVIVSSLQRLEADVLSSREASLEEARRRFGLLIVIDLHRLDTTLLRLRLIRLSRLLEGRALLSVAQSAPRAGLWPQLLAVLAPLGVDKVRPISLTGQDAARRFQLIWRNDAEALKALFEKDLGKPLPDTAVELAPLTLARAWKRGIAATFFDLAGRVDSKLWLGTVPNQMRGMLAGIGPDEMRDFEAGKVSFPKREHRVVVIEDLANLVEAMSRSVNFMNNPDVLVHIVAHDYPLRDFLCSVLRDDGGRESLLPIASSPRGGPAELALALADEILKAPNGCVSERALTRCFEDSDVGERLQHETWGDTTRRGLTELLGAQLGYVPEIRVETSAGHERQLIFRAPHELRLDPTYMLDLLRDGRSDPYRSYLDRNDNGLTYIKGSLIQLRGSFVRINRVDTGEGEVRGTTSEIGGSIANSRTLNRPRYRFSRLYDPNLLAKELVLLGERVSAATAPMQSLVLLLRGPVTRFTVGFHEMAELARPFTAGHAPDWQEETVRTNMRQAVQILLRLRVGDPVGADRARCAFTLATTLQDVLWSMFPWDGERLAVLSPQAAPAVDAVLKMDHETESVDPFELYPAVLMPRLAEGLSDVEPREPSRAWTPGGLLRPPVEQSHALDAIARMIRAHRQDSEGNEILNEEAVVRFSEGDRFLDFLLIEDASHDLGCLRALFEEAHREAVMNVWRRYVRWCAGETGSKDFYYCYGDPDGRVPAIFDFAAAADVLERWMTGGAKR